MKEKKKKVYIGGKMTGMTKEESQALFNRAEAALKLVGYKVVNPWKIRVPKYYSGQLLRSLKELAKCDAIFLLENWTDSNGAKCEYWFAKGMGLEIMFEDTNFDYHKIAEGLQQPTEFTTDFGNRSFVVRVIREIPSEGEKSVKIPISMDVS